MEGAAKLSLLFAILLSKITLDSDITVAPLSGHSYWTRHKTKAELSLKPVCPSPIMQENAKGGLGEQGYLSWRTGVGVGWGEGQYGQTKGLQKKTLKNKYLSPRPIKTDCLKVPHSWCALGSRRSRARAYPCLFSLICGDILTLGKGGWTSESGEGGSHRAAFPSAVHPSATQALLQWHHRPASLLCSWCPVQADIVPDDSERSCQMPGPWSHLLVSLCSLSRAAWEHIVSRGQLSKGLMLWKDSKRLPWRDKLPLSCLYCYCVWRGLPRCCQPLSKPRSPARCFSVGFVVVLFDYSFFPPDDKMSHFLLSNHLKGLLAINNGD